MSKSLFRYLASSLAVCAVLACGALLQAGSLGGIQGQAAPLPAEGGGAIVVSLGKDSPSAGKDAYVTYSLSTVEAAKVGKLVSRISYPNTGELELDRAELTPDLKSAGATLEVVPGPAGGVSRELRLTITSKAAILDGIIANIVFKVINRPRGDRMAGEGMQVRLDHQAEAWTTDDRPIDVVTAEPGEVDFEYAPVVFACFFYMH